MAQPCVVVFCMPERGHFQRLSPLIAGLAGRGIVPYVYTDVRFRDAAEQAGGWFVDLFAERPIDAADAASVPVPCRYVSFAAHYAESIIADVEARAPTLVVHDTFAVVGPVVASRLRLPCVNVCAGHNLAPGPTLESLRRDPRVAISADCERAVQTLRDIYDLPDVTPFSYVCNVSRDLNVYCEPPEFLRSDERVHFEPITFFGSLAEEPPPATDGTSRAFKDQSPETLRLYASFGTVAWRYYATRALATLTTLANAVAEMEHIEVLISLGGWNEGRGLEEIAGPNVRVADYVDQRSVLREASAFLTHQGLNSTHEAIYQRVPMISYPFFSDQPGLAKRCQELGLAVPLVDSVRGTVESDDIRRALARIVSRRDAMGVQLERARRWETEVIATRPAVIERILGLSR